MCPETVHIESLHLRVSGMDPAQAASFAEKVARGMQQGLAAQQSSEQIGSIDLGVSAPESGPQDGLAALVAERILLGLLR
jgi:hypothetical protein